MKALSEFTNVSKAAALHQLFPGEMPALIDFIKGMCVSIRSNEERSRSAFGDGLFSFDFWLYLLGQVENVIDGKRKLLEKSDKVFSEQLFEGYLACFSNHCVIVYVTEFEHPNPKFTLAVNLFFK